ncbi:MAG: hypothetical protein V1735_03615 [Nanoarchaeota archaeon]
MDKPVGVSKKTIAVLLVVTIFLSLVGVWVMLNAIELHAEAQEKIQSLAHTEGSGQVLLTINRPPTEVTGQVVLTIRGDDHAQ